MSLLTEASLIVTPNGYNVGKLYSVVPNTTLGDMDVVRATSATRVNSAGLIEIARTNLVLYSEQFDNASWQKVGGGIASAPVVTPNVETAPDGTMTADRVFFTLNGGTSSLDLSSLGSNAFTFTSLTRTQSVYIKTTDGTTRNFSFVSPTGISTSITVTSVYQRFTFTVPNGTIVSSTIRLRLRGSASGEGTATSATIAIWGAQYEEGSVATEYIPTVASIRTKFAGITQDGSVAQNIPRLDYPPLGGCPSILVEPLRTNLVLYSEEFDNAAWVPVSSTITANAAISPSGATNAETMTIVDSNSRVAQAITLGAGTYRVSVYVKVISQTTAGTIRLQSIVDGSNVNVSFTPTTEWQRVEGTFTAAVGITSFLIRGNASAFVGTIAIWGFQVEAGSNATSYIPTTSASVTRNADQISLGNVYTNNLITASGGTWFVEFRNNVPLTRDSNTVGLNLDTSLGANGFAIRNNASATRLTISKYIASSRTDLYVTTTNTCKIAIKWNGTTADIFENGAKVVSATAFTTTAMEVINGFSADVTRYINQMALFPTALTDTQCTQLTT